MGKMFSLPVLGQQLQVYLYIIFIYQQHPTLQVSEMDAFVDLKVAGGDLLEGPGMSHFGMNKD